MVGPAAPSRSAAAIHSAAEHLRRHWRSSTTACTRVGQLLPENLIAGSPETHIKVPILRVSNHSIVINNIMHACLDQAVYLWVAASRQGFGTLLKCEAFLRTTVKAANQLHMSGRSDTYLLAVPPVPLPLLHQLLRTIHGSRSCPTFSCWVFNTSRRSSKAAAAAMRTCSVQHALHGVHCRPRHSRRLLRDPSLLVPLTRGRRRLKARQGAGVIGSHW